MVRFQYLVSEEHVFKEKSNVHVEMRFSLLLPLDDFQLLLRVQAFDELVRDVLLRYIAQNFV
jgi:hypothetical protein